MVNLQAKELTDCCQTCPPTIVKACGMLSRQDQSLTFIQQVKDMNPIDVIEAWELSSREAKFLLMLCVGCTKLLVK